MEIWYNVIVFSKETLVHYYHKYVKAGVSPVSNSECASGNRALETSKNLEKFPFLKCASSNRALNFLGNFRKFPGNFLETVRVVTGQETVRVGMWSLQMGMPKISAVYLSRK